MFYRKPDFTRLLLIAPRCDPPQRPPERSHTEHRTGISPKRVSDATSSCSINVNPDLGLTLCLMTSVIPNRGPSTIFFTATNSRNNGCPISPSYDVLGPCLPMVFQFPIRRFFISPLGGIELATLRFVSSEHNRYAIGPE